MLTVGSFCASCVNRSQKMTWDLIAEAKSIHEPNFSHPLFLDPNNGMVISGLEMIRSADGGRTWSSISLSSGKEFYSFAFADHQNGWAVGTDSDNKPLIMMTVDGGFTWQSVTFDQQAVEEVKATKVTDICLTSGQVWLLTENSITGPIRDPSGNEIWSRRQLGNNAIVRAVINDTTLRIVNVFYMPDRLRSISCTSTGEVWAVGDRSAVFHYENGWKNAASEVDKKYTFLRAASSGKDVWLVGADWSETESVVAGFPRAGVLLRSRDNGQTWRDETPSSASLLSDLILADGKGWLIGAQGSIFFSSDSGNSWTKIESPTRNNLSQIFFLDSQNIWIVGEQSTILRLSKN